MRTVSLLTLAGVLAALLGAAAPLRHHLIRPRDMPPPFATRSVSNAPRVVPRRPGWALHLSPGFHVATWATGLDNPRWMALAPNGDVLVVESRANRVTLFRNTKGAARPGMRHVFASHLHLPFGIAFFKPWVYIANTNSVVRYPYRPGQLEVTGRPQVVAHLPGLGYNQHWTRTVICNPAGTKMLVSIGSRGNEDVEGPPRAAVMEYNPDGTGARVYASGLRNAVGLAFQPGTDQLWATVNERDDLGNDVPPDYVRHVQLGGFYGWPYSYIGAHPEPRMHGRRPDLVRKAIVPDVLIEVRKAIVPDVLIEAHTAPLGILFYTGHQFPAEYRGDAFVALHGSWNRYPRDGYKIICIPMKNGRPAGGYNDFLTGWAPDPRGREVWGRPVGLLQLPDGSLLVSDDGANKIWRVSYSG